VNEAAAKGKRPWSLILSGLVLSAAVVLQGVNLGREIPPARGPHLAGSVPLLLPGWTAQDVPLGANEFLSGVAEKMLNYDEFVFREYTRGGEKFGVYVAYWGAGKMPARLVASHTPDRCWTENGWRCLQMKFKAEEEFDGVKLQPAEWRLFEPPGGGPPTYVLYWHLVAGRTYDYGDRFNRVPDPVLWWKDAMQQALRGNREQYFIRLTSSEPLENLRRDQGFMEIVRGLERLGLELGSSGDKIL
jgi:Protein of unknown function (DUF3485)